MIRIVAPLALALLAAPAAGSAEARPAASAKPQPAASARARANLVTLFSDEDYPAAAVRNHEQGPVAFSLSVGSDGAPTACSVTGSSGSAILDSTTCTLLMARAHFEPAHDARGRPTTDTVAGRIVWRLPDDETDPPPALVMWMLCVGGEAAKLVPGDLPPAEVARRAFPPCKALEAIVAPDPERARLLAERRHEFERMIEGTVATTRAALAAAPVPLETLQRELPR
ncbi:MAG: periplasmic protein TonB [Sphingomonadales bacterium]|jgi:TonB family protein|nr:periplasmic protein TonB [Sphingomonadales bacterium]